MDEVLPSRSLCTFVPPALNTPADFIIILTSLMRKKLLIKCEKLKITYNANLLSGAIKKVNTYEQMMMLQIVVSDK